MKKILVAVMSQDGFIANPEIDQFEWVSAEDTSRFEAMRNEHDFFIMGRRTYEDNAGNMKPRPGLLRVVMTRNPSVYTNSAVSGQLEFSAKSPQRIIEENSNKKSCLILGGSMVYEEFLGAGLVDEINLTIEPVELGSGVPLLSSGRNLLEDQSLPEPKITELNDQGTLLYQYTLN